MTADENIAISSLASAALVFVINIFLCCFVKVKPSTIAAQLSLCLMPEFQFLSEVIVDEALVFFAKLTVGVC